MISIITEITRRKLFRYASNDCVCEFISEPWESENYFDMRQMTVFVNLFQNLGSGYMKLLPEFQIESISASEKKTRR